MRTDSPATAEAIIPENARLVLKPTGYIRELEPRAHDMAVVNGARASFNRYKPAAELDYKDVDLITKKLMPNGHETPFEQHVLWIYVHNVPRQVLNLVPDEIDFRMESDGTASFPWALNFRHAMTFYRRLLRTRRPTNIAIGNDILTQFVPFMPISVDSFLETLGKKRSDLSEFGVESRYAETWVVDRGAEDHLLDEEAIIDLAGAHLHRGYNINDRELLGEIFDEHPHLLNLWAATWQIRGPIHIFWDLVRHRKSSPNGESGRYSKLQNDFLDLDPKDVRFQSEHAIAYAHREANGQLQQNLANEFASDLEGHYERGAVLYNRAIDAGIAREQASWFQGLASMRTFVWTWRGLGLINMLGLRNAPPALKELRLYAAEMEKDVQTRFPIFHEAFIEHARKAP